MDAEFWHAKWRTDQIGFHEAAPHPLLLAWWSTLALHEGARVFVPLCGKSTDLMWLHRRGHAVVAIELSEIAVAAFFDEHQLAVQISEHGALRCYRGSGFEIWCGDVFDLEQAMLGEVAAIYDRAALIALPPATRAEYCKHLSRLALPGTQMLLITVDYDQRRLQPPPFVVPTTEIETCMVPAWALTALATTTAEVKGEPATETVYQLTRN